MDEARERLARIRGQLHTDESRDNYRDRQIRWLCDELESALSAGTFTEGVDTLAKEVSIRWREGRSEILPALVHAIKERALKPTPPAQEPRRECYPCQEGHCENCCELACECKLCKFQAPAESAQPTPQSRREAWDELVRQETAEGLYKIPDDYPASSEPTPAPATVQSEPVDLRRSPDRRVAYNADKNEMRRFGGDRRKLPDYSKFAWIEYALSNRATAPPAANVGELVKRLVHVSKQLVDSLQRLSYGYMATRLDEAVKAVEAAMSNAAAHEGDTK